MIALANDDPVTATATRKSQRRSMPARMRAAVITSPGEVTIQELALPQPGAGEVRVHLQGCGVCASNIPVWEGREWFSYPMPPGNPGHEGWGIVDQVGAGVSALREGQRVAMISDHAYAQYDIADARNVIPLPDELADQPFPAEPLGCVMNVYNRGDILEGHTVAIIGIGLLGALLTQLASRAGATVYAISRRQYSLDVARQCGADETILMDDHWRILETVKELTGGEWCDRVIECVGYQWPLDLAGELTRIRGKLIIAGYHQDGPRQVNMQQWNWRGLDVINAHERDPQRYVDGIRAAIHAVCVGRLQPQSLFTHHFRLEELGKALDMIQQRPDGFLKGLITLG